MSMTVEKKKCIDCGASEIYADGIYCNSCKRFVGRSNEQTCVLTDSVKNEMSMTESEAIAELKTFPVNCLDFKENQALQIAVDLLEQYRAIGTVSEFRELKEKATEKKVVEAYGKDVTFYLCPSCERVVANSHLKIEPRNCSCCAQKLDWSEGKE